METLKFAKNRDPTACSDLSAALQACTAFARHGKARFTTSLEQVKMAALFSSHNRCKVFLGLHFNDIGITYKPINNKCVSQPSQLEVSKGKGTGLGKND